MCEYSEYFSRREDGVRKLCVRHLTSLHLHSVHCDWDPPPAPSSHRGWSRGVPSPSAALFQNIKRAQWLRPSTVSPFCKMSWCRVACCYISSWESHRLYGSKHTVDRRWYVSHAHRKYQTRVRGKGKETGSLWRWAAHPFTHITVMCWRWIKLQTSNKAPHHQFIILIKHQNAAVYQMTDLFKTHRTAFGTWTLLNSVQQTGRQYHQINAVTSVVWC